MIQCSWRAAGRYGRDAGGACVVSRAEQLAGAAGRAGCAGVDDGGRGRRRRGRRRRRGVWCGLLIRAAAVAVRVGVSDRDGADAARVICRAGRGPPCRDRARWRRRMGGLVAHSLATALVTAGVPAVIGWDGSVDDRAATVFAERLYRRWRTRRIWRWRWVMPAGCCWRPRMPRVRADWHLARLWLGPSGGGPVVAGRRRSGRWCRRCAGRRRFWIARQHVPVAAPDMFVGRRPELQQALRALRSAGWAGVLLHGQGRLGKSSLAARIADRLPDRAVAVVFGDYSRVGGDWTRSTTRCGPTRPRGS